MIGSLILLTGWVMGCGGGPMDQQLPVKWKRRADINIDTLGVEATVPASADRTWQVLPSVLTDLGLDINFREPGPKRVGTCYQPLRNRLGRLPLSTLIDCGDVLSQPNADRFEVQLTVLTTVIPVSAHSAKIATFVLGVGKDPSAGGSRLWCYSTGQLEGRIRQMVEERAGA